MADELDLVFYDPQEDSSASDDDVETDGPTIGEHSRAPIEVGEWFLETLARHGRRVLPPSSSPPA